MVSKISSLCETKYDDDPTEEPDDESDPVISVSTIPHRGAVNRIRVCLPLLPLLLSVFRTDRKSWAFGPKRASSASTTSLRSSPKSKRRRLLPRAPPLRRLSRCPRCPPTLSISSKATARRATRWTGRSVRRDCSPRAIAPD